MAGAAPIGGIGGPRGGGALGADPTRSATAPPITGAIGAATSAQTSGALLPYSRPATGANAAAATPANGAATTHSSSPAAGTPAPGAAAAAPTGPRKALGAIPLGVRLTSTSGSVADKKKVDHEKAARRRERDNKRAAAVAAAALRNADTLVSMSGSNRDFVEGVLRQLGLLGGGEGDDVGAPDDLAALTGLAGGLSLDDDTVDALEVDLAGMGFTAEAAEAGVRAAVRACSATHAAALERARANRGGGAAAVQAAALDMGEVTAAALDWLCLNLPESDLPRRFAPQKRGELRLLNPASLFAPPIAAQQATTGSSTLSSTVGHRSSGGGGVSGGGTGGASSSGGYGSGVGGPRVVKHASAIASTGTPSSATKPPPSSAAPAPPSFFAASPSLTSAAPLRPLSSPSAGVARDVAVALEAAWGVSPPDAAAAVAAAAAACGQIARPTDSGNVAYSGGGGGVPSPFPTASVGNVGQYIPTHTDLLVVASSLIQARLRSTLQLTDPSDSSCGSAGGGGGKNTLSVSASTVSAGVFTGLPPSIGDTGTVAGVCGVVFTHSSSLPLEPLSAAAQEAEALCAIYGPDVSVEETPVSGVAACVLLGQRTASTLGRRGRGVGVAGVEITGSVSGSLTASAAAHSHSAARDVTLGSGGGGGWEETADAAVADAHAEAAAFAAAAAARVSDLHEIITLPSSTVWRRIRVVCSDVPSPASTLAASTSSSSAASKAGSGASAACTAVLNLAYPVPADSLDPTAAGEADAQLWGAAAATESSSSSDAVGDVRVAVGLPYPFASPIAWVEWTDASLSSTAATASASSSSEASTSSVAAGSGSAAHSGVVPALYRLAINAHLQIELARLRCDAAANGAEGEGKGEGV